MSDFGFYIFVLIAAVVGFILLKKITTCLLRTVVLAAIVAALIYIYMTYFAA